MKDGTWISHHKNGQLSSKGNYKDGEKVGIHVKFTQKGKQFSECDHSKKRTWRRDILSPTRPRKDTK